MSDQITPKEKKNTPARRNENGRVLALENDLAVLAGLNQYGFLSALQLTALVWPRTRHPRIAQRTLKRLIENGLAQRQFNKTAQCLYALTARGANFLHASRGIKAQATTSLLDGCLRTFNHRSLANDLCIWWQSALGRGSENVFTEYNVWQGKGPVVRTEALFGEVKGKIPDGVLLAAPLEDAVKGLVVPVAWCEVEMSKKRGKDYEHLIRNTCHLLGGYGKGRYALPNSKDKQLAKGLYEIHYVVVACPDEEHEYKLAKAVLEQLASVGWKRYNWSYVQQGVYIWSPSGACVDLKTWVERRPDMVQWYDTLRAKWSDKNFGRD